MNKNETTRRDFLLNIVRVGTGIVLAIGGALLALRNRETGENAIHKCIGDSYCSACPINEKCVLPLAVSRRLVIEQKTVYGKKESSDEI